jgi:alpha-ribazole phosphatase
MRLIHLVRHSRPSINGLILGRTDLPLAAPVPPSTLDVQAVYSSPLARARRTAEQMFPGHAITFDPGLAERNMGDWDGLPWTEIEIRWPTQATAALQDWFSFTPPNAEPWVRFTDRVHQAWHRIPTQGDIAIIAHAGVNAVLARSIAGVNVTTFRQHYEEVTTLEIPDEHTLT